MTRGVIAAAAAFLLALAPAALAQPTAPAPTPPAAGEQAAPAPAAPAAAEPATAPPPAAATTAPAETGRIVFFRPSRLTGAIYTYHIVETGEDGKAAKDAPRLGSLKNGGAFSVDVPAGIHNFNITGPMAVNKAEDRLRIEVEPGQTYYVEQTVRMGLITGGFRLEPGDEARFLQSKAKLPPPAP